MNDDELKVKAASCSGCSCWTGVCNAECCREFKIPTVALKKHKYGQSVRTVLTDDLVWYFRLRGCGYVDGELIFPVAAHRRRVDGEFTIMIRDCDLLEGVRCKGHPDNKPNICKEFDETKGCLKNAYVTKNCLANYKGMK